MKSMLKSLGYAWKGIRIAFSEQRNMRIHFAAACLVMTLGLCLDLPSGEWLAILLTIGLVFTAEMINTSIEGLTDLVSPERKPAAGKIKDVAAGAVLLSALTAIVVGVAIFGPRLVTWVETHF